MDRKSSEFNIKFHTSIHGILLSSLRILFSSFQNIETNSNSNDKLWKIGKFRRIWKLCRFLLFLHSTYQAQRRRTQWLGPLFSRKHPRRFKDLKYLGTRGWPRNVRWRATSLAPRSIHVRGWHYAPSSSTANLLWWS